MQGNSQKKKKKKAEKTDTSASGSRKKNLQLKQWLLYMLPMKTPAAAGKKFIHVHKQREKPLYIISTFYLLFSAL